MGPIIVAFIALVIASLVLWLIGYTLYGLFIAPVIFQFKLYQGVNEEQKNTLRQKFPYYMALSAKYKIEFERRLKYFLMNKEFISKKMEITEEMKTLIGACAVQLTLGFQPLRFTHFPKILLFPKTFKTKTSSKLKKGEVNSGGLIVLSWEDFIKDYHLTDDGINLGLHEMAHALKIEDAFPDDEFEFLSEQDLRYFYEVSTEEYVKIRRRQPSFIRSYAGTDREEFFAVAVEQFFEQPKQFREALPDIYEALARLLKQNPAENTIQG